MAALSTRWSRRQSRVSAHSPRGNSAPSSPQRTRCAPIIVPVLARAMARSIFGITPLPLRMVLAGGAIITFDDAEGCGAGADASYTLGTWLSNWRRSDGRCGGPASSDEKSTASSSIRTTGWAFR